MPAVTARKRRRRSIWAKLWAARKLSLHQWTDLASAAAALLTARIRFARLSAKDLVAHLEGTGNNQNKSIEQSPPDPKTAAYLARLDWSIQAVANIVPWRSDCLIRCLAANSLLRRRGLEPVFRIGVQKNDAGELAAHAWTYCHGIPIAGGDGSGFEVLIGPDRQRSGDPP